VVERLRDLGHRWWRRHDEVGEAQVPPEIGAIRPSSRRR
jgi:hypothetical protein